MQHRLASILRQLRRVVAPRAEGGLGDAQLLERFAVQRDEAAFEVLVWRHGPMVLGVGRRVLRNLHDAEDVLQATFLALVRQARSIGRREALGAWLHKVAYRTAVRARAQRRKRTAEPMMDTPAPDSLARKPGHEALALLDEELQRLPAKYRTPLVLSYLQGQTNQEIASDLGCPIGTVFTRLARGREMLRLRLVRRGVTLSSGVMAAALTQTAPAAPLAAELVKTTLHAAMAFAAGTTAVSPHVAALTEGVLKMMWLSKLKLIAVVLVLTALAGTGAGFLAFRVSGQERDDGNKVAATDEKPAAENRRPAREALRYGGKTFNDWHNTLMIDLKPEVRAEAIKALSAFGAHGYAREAVPIIVEAMRDYNMAAAFGDDEKVVTAGRDGLWKIGAEAAVPVLIQEVKKGKRNGRLFALACLASFSPEDAKPAVPAVIDAIKDDAIPIRLHAIETLQQIDREGASTRALAAVLADQEFGVRSRAIAALERLGPKAKEAIPQLLTASRKDEDRENRTRALHALEVIKPSAQEFLPTLKDALKDQDFEVRGKACHLLGNLGGAAKDVVPELIAVLKNPPDPNDAIRAVQTLGLIGPSAKAAVPALTEALQQKNVERRNPQLSATILQALERINK